MKILTGKTFGRLQVIGFAGLKPRNDGRNWAMWNCACWCGNSVVVRGINLTSGNTKSCGCYQKYKVSVAAKVHGHRPHKSSSRTYNSWHSMIQRCTNSNYNRFADYGGRGITVCKRWRNSFAAFLKDMGERPSGMTLDRKNVNGNYTPKNCRWATPKEQISNQRKK